MDKFDQITRTKILLPRRRPELLFRERLLDLSYDLLDFKLVLVAAPAGYGKTTLLVDLAHNIELPVCWFALDALDRDPHHFLAHFIASIAHCFPNFGQRSEAVMQSSTGKIDLDRLISTIVNEIYGQIREYFVLVLDDYHLVNDCEEIAYFVNRFIQQVSENCHLIISSRTLVSLSDLPLMVARAQVGGLGFEELAFRSDEIQALMLQNHHMTMSEVEAEDLVRETEGWITGLLLSAQTMSHGLADRLRAARIAGVGLYDYLAQQVLDQQPAPVQDFLLRTSCLEEFNAELCELILGPAEYPGGENWSSLIETVLNGNLFVLPVSDAAERGLDNPDTWLRYHHLFRDFLQVHLTQEYPGEKEKIFRRLASSYMARGAWDKAHALYQQIDDLEATVELIEEAGPSLVRNGRLSILGRWLDSLPASILSARPALLSLRGYIAVNLGEVDQGLDLLDRAEAISRSTSNRLQLAQALVWRAIGHRFQANYRASLVDADEALALARQDADLAQVEAEAFRAKGICLYHMGRLEEAAEWLEQSLEAYTTLRQAHNVAIILSESAMVCMGTGAYQQALTHSNRALDHWRMTKNIIWQATILNNLGYLWHLNGDFEQAGSLLEESLTCARQSGNARFESFALASIGDLYHDLDASDAAQLAYRQSREVAQRIGDHYVLLYLNLAEAAIARKQRKFAKARRLLEAARQLALKSDSDYEQGLYQLEVGKLAMAEGKIPEVISELEGAAQRFNQGGQRVEGARSYLYLALASQAMGDDKATVGYLERSFNIASELESQHPLVIAGRDAKQLLQIAQADPALGEQASLLLQRVDRFEQEIPTLRRLLRQQASVVPFARPKLLIQALGQTQVTLDDKVLTNADWQVKGARELFFYLLAHPAGITKDVIGASFWPNSSPKQLKLKFKNTLYRLRRALGSNVVVLDEETDRYRFNQTLDYEYDVDSFWQKLERARSESDPELRRLAYQEAIHLYAGDYLLEVDGIWAWPEREKLQHAYLEALVRLAELHLEAREYGQALDYCRLALKQDPCLEEVHRLAMRIHAAMGNRAAVVRQYKACQQSLQAEVKAAPSPETERLYRTLLR